MQDENPKLLANISGLKEELQIAQAELDLQKVSLQHQTSRLS